MEFAEGASDIMISTQPPPLLIPPPPIEHLENHPVSYWNRVLVCVELIIVPFIAP